MTFNQLFLIYIVTIVASRIVLWFWPRHAPLIGKFQTHHYMHGVILALVSLPLHWPWLLAIGIGLIVDEVPLFFIFRTWDWPHDHWKQYHSRQSIIAIVLISLAGFLIISTFLPARP